MNTFLASTRRRTVVTGAALALLLAACGDSETDATGTTASTTSTVEEESTTTTTTPTTSSSTTTEPEVVSSEPVPDADLPGVSLAFGPGEGSVVLVVGVEVDDVLNVRQLPDPQAEIVEELNPLDDAVLTGRTRDLGTSIWHELEWSGGVGWANATYLSPAGGTRDATNEFRDLLGGSLPTGTSTLEVIDDLVDQLHAAGSEEGPPRTVTIVDGPVVGDLDTVVIDVLGYPDDAVRGDRLMVFVRNEAGTTDIKSIESTSLCQRGSDGAFCL